MTNYCDYAVFILDHDKTKADVSQWYQHDLNDPPKHTAVFADTPFQALSEIGPQLLHVSVESDLFHIAKKQVEQQGQGCIFYTNSSFETVCDWASQAVSVSIDNRRALCRFFAFDFVQGASQVIGEERWSCYLAPIEKIDCYKDEEWFLTAVQQITPSREVQEFYISQEELERLTNYREERFYKTLADYYKAQITAINAYDWVKAQCKKAKSLDFESHYIQEQWLRNTIQYGENFSLRIDIKECIQNQADTPLRRWQNIEDLLASSNS